MLCLGEAARKERHAVSEHNGVDGHNRFIKEIVPIGSATSALPPPGLVVLRSLRFRSSSAPAISPGTILA